MSKPENFILNTDYPTLKNDASGTLQVTIPASQVIASGAYWQGTADLVIGAQGSFIRSTISSSRDNKIFVAHNLTEQLTGTSPLGATYYVVADIYRKNATTVTLSVFIFNNLAPATSLTTIASTETITATVRTFIPPFA